MNQSSSTGRFVWYELMTSDPDAAIAFYTDVVGWGTMPFDGAPMPYTMWTKGERPVGGVLEMPAEAAPPTWMGHVRVDDVDAVAARVEERGGSILHGPESLEEVGRWVVFADPQGAVISAFRPETESNGSDEPEPGDVSWHELATSDHEAAFEFYADLFGWEKDHAMDMGEAGVYQMYNGGGRMLGGMYDQSPDMPGPGGSGRPAWLYYLRVADLDGAVEKVRSGGGTVVVEPMEVPGGSRIAVAIDPQGAAFGLHEGAAEGTT